MANKPAVPTKETKLTRRLLREKEKNDWTYEDLAEKLGTTPSQAHDLAMGRHDPQLETLRDIARRLNCKIIDLIDAA